jgi:hypothetical protein
MGIDKLIPPDPDIVKKYEAHVRLPHCNKDTDEKS